MIRRFWKKIVTFKGKPPDWAAWPCVMLTNDVTSYLSDHARSARWCFTPRRCSRSCKLWLNQPVVSLGPGVWEWRIASNAFISLDCGQTSVSCRNWSASNRLMGAVMAQRGGSLMLSALVLIWRRNGPLLSRYRRNCFLFSSLIGQFAGSHLVSSRQSRLLLCSALPSDFMVKVVEVSDSSQQKTLRGHEAPVLSVAMDPKDVYLVGYRVFFFFFTNVSKTAILFVGLGHSHWIDLWSLWAVRCSRPMRLDVCCSLGNTLVPPMKGSYAVKHSLIS